MWRGIYDHDYGVAMAAPPKDLLLVRLALLGLLAGSSISPPV
jgi:hypothetical protein